MATLAHPAQRFVAVALGIASCLSMPAFADTVKVLVAIGHDVGDVDDAPLQFAAEDARRVAQVFVELGGVSSNDAVVLVDQPADAVRSKLLALKARIAQLSAQGHDVIFFIYVSSHARAGVLHLGGTHLPIAELSSLAQQTKARLRVVIVDACDGAARVGTKGATSGQPFAVTIDKLPLEGQVFISSSGPAEPAQEWGTLGGALFTHHLLGALRGDGDLEGDGRVTLSEAYSYAYRRTVQSAAMSGQHPSFDLDLSGTGELVLTEPSRGGSALVFPSALEGRYVVSSAPRRDVVLEVDKVAGRALRLAVPPGRYRVLKRQGATLGLLDVELPWGGEGLVDDSKLIARAHTEVATRGSVELRASSLLLTGALESEPLESSGPRWRAGLAYRHTFGAWWLSGGVSFGHVSFRGIGLGVSEAQGAVTVAAGYRLLWAPVMPTLGVFVEPTLLSQRIVRDEEAALQRVLRAPALEPRTAFAFVFGPSLGLEVPLPWQAVVMAAVQLRVRHLVAEDQPAWTIGVAGTLALGWRF